MRLPKIFSRRGEPTTSRCLLDWPNVDPAVTAWLGPTPFLGHSPVAAEAWPKINQRSISVIAGTPDLLGQFAEQVVAGPILFERRAVVLAATFVGKDPVTQSLKDALWRVLGCPVYEIFADKDAGVLAAECEAHEGWHVRQPQLRYDLMTMRLMIQRGLRSSSLVPTGLIASGMDGCCSCNDTTPLLRDVRKAAVPEKLQRTLAVSA